MIDPFLLIARLSDDSAIMTDVVVDVETTGTNSHLNNMIQLAAIKFNYETGEVGGVFDRCLAFAPNRFWDEDTRRWWGQQKRSVLDGILARAEDPGQVIHAYSEFICKEGRPLRFWSRGAFDYNFVESYHRQFGLPMPHRFNDARDTRSFLAGLYGQPKEPDMSWITAPGDAHNALRDNVVELKRLFAAKDKQFHEVIPA
jgi:DNA polymerase III epsilon subunit-like protein